MQKSIKNISNNQNFDFNKENSRGGVKFFEKNFSQWWRCIAAIFIMIGHLIPDDCPIWVKYFFTGSIWVGIFFFYSGYGMQFSFDSNDGYLDGFITRKIRYVYIPFVVAESLYFCIVNVMLKGNQIHFLDILLYITGVKLANSVLWYVI